MPGPQLSVEDWLEAGAPFPPDSSSMLIATIQIEDPPPKPRFRPPMDASPAPVQTPSPLAPAAPPAPPQAVEAQPDHFDVATLKSAIPEGLKGPEVLAFATIASLSAIAFRVLPRALDGRHEEAMARIKQQGNHAPCAARIAELEARVAKSETLVIPPLPSDVLERIERLEDAAKARSKVSHARKG